MFRSTPYETAIEVASALKDHISELSTCYSDLLKMIDAEHAAISRSDLYAIEDIVEHKVMLGTKIEEQVNAIRQLGARAATLFQRIFEAPVEAPASISGCLDLLTTIQASQPEDNFAAQLFNRIMIGANGIFGAFKTLREQTEPKIEMNRYLTEKLLYHHQESYRFWQGVAQDSEATYNSGGSHKNTVSPPMLRVKA